MYRTRLKILTGILMTAFWLLLLYSPNVSSASLRMALFFDVELSTIVDIEKDTIKMQETEPLLDIQFEHPAMVAPDDEFTFTIHLIKHPGFRPSGSITQRWPKGFLPRNNTLEHGSMTIENRQVVIKWDRLPQHGKVSFSYPVEVMNITGSTYPVITEYRDVVGVNFNRTTGLHVMEGEKAIADIPLYVQPEATPADYSLTARYPIEVKQEQSFEMVFTITKGKNVSPAELLIKLPPGFRPDTDFDLPHNFVQGSGVLVVSWENMPASPVFEVPVSLYVAKPSHAVYPFSAKFLINDESVATYDKYVIVVREKGQIVFPDTISQQTAPDIDTTSMFSELDAILNEWVNQNAKEQSSAAEIGVPGNRKQVGGTGVDDISQPFSDTDSDTDFRIQIFASVIPMTGLAEKFTKMGIYEKLNEDFDGRMYRYTLGMFADKNGANEYLRFLQSKGFPDAFVVRYVDGERQK